MAGKSLIVKLGAIGDVASVLPAAWHLHQSGSKIEWLCGRAVAPLLSCYSWIHPIVVNDAHLLNGNRTSAMGEILRTWGKLAGRSYDLCAILQYDSRYRILTAPVRAKRSIILKRSARDSNLVSERHHSAEYMRILGGLPDEYRTENVAPIRPDMPSPNPFPRGPKTRIALMPGGARNLLRDDSQRRWPLDFYQTLARLLLEKGYEVVITGGPQDKWVQSKFIDLPVDDRVGQWTIPETLSFYDSCDCVITHDTGPMHLAGLVGCGLIGLFGPTAPSKFLPRRKGVIGLWGGEQLACRPCYDGFGYANCNWNGCMISITVEKVLSTVESLLRQAHADWQIEHL